MDKTELAKLKVLASLDGRVDPAFKLSTPLCNLLAKARDMPVDDLALRVLSASLSFFTMLLDHDNMVASLGPFRAARGKTFVPNRSRLFEADVSPAVRGRYMSQVGNALYRLGQLDEALRWLDDAGSCFAREHQGGLELTLAKAENAIWRARVLVRTTRGLTVLRDLETDAMTPLYAEIAAADVAKKLGQAQTVHEFASISGARHRLGIALSLAGGIYSSRAEGEKALNCLWEALSHLASQGVEDAVRHAHCQLATAEALISHRKGSNRLAFVLASDAERKLRDSAMHPFASRASIVQAQALIADHPVAGSPVRGAAREQELALAEKLLLGVAGGAGAESRGDPVLEREGLFVTAQATLVRGWATERTGGWSAALPIVAPWVELARKEGGLPDRLRADLCLLHGRARLGCGFADGWEDIERAQEIARKDERIKIQIACALARAEALFSGQRKAGARESAQGELERARSMGADVDNGYLREWLDTLTMRVNSAAIIRLEEPYAVAEERFKQRYLEYHRGRSNDNLQQILHMTGLSQSTYYRMRADLEEPKGPRKR